MQLGAACCAAAARITCRWTVSSRRYAGPSDRSSHNTSSQDYLPVDDTIPASNSRSSSSCGAAADGYAGNQAAVAMLSNQRRVHYRHWQRCSRPGGLLHVVQRVPCLCCRLSSLWRRTPTSTGKTCLYAQGGPSWTVSMRWPASPAPSACPCSSCTAPPTRFAGCLAGCSTKQICPGCLLSA